MAVSERQQVEVGEVVLRYDELGTGDPPLLLLHGFTGAAVDFVDVAPELARDRRVVLYDQRGHGDSTNTGDASHVHLRSAHRRPRGLRRGAGSRAVRPPRPLDGRDHLDAVRVGASGARALARVDGHRGRADAARLADVFGGLTKMGREQGMDAVFAVIRQFWVQQAEAAGQRRAGGHARTRRTEVLDDGSRGVRDVRRRVGRVSVDGRAARRDHLPDDGDRRRQRHRSARRRPTCWPNASPVPS